MEISKQTHQYTDVQTYRRVTRWKQRKETGGELETSDQIIRLQVQCIETQL